MTPSTPTAANPALNPRAAAAAARLLLLAAGLGLMARPAYHWARGAADQLAAAATWARAMDQAAARPARAGVPGSPAAWLDIPRADVSTVVLYGATPENLNRYPCLATSPRLTDDGAFAGLVFISAHRDRHFRKLGRLAPGDPIDLRTSRGALQRYRVSAVETVTPSEARARVWQQAAEDPSRLVLMTCYPLRYLGPAPLRLLIWADPTPTL